MKIKVLNWNKCINWIKTQTQFNNKTNNIHNDPNKYLNNKNNPLLYENKNLIKNKTNSHNKAYIDSNNTDLELTDLKNNKSIYTFPENTKLNKKEQKNKMDDLLNIRRQHDKLLRLDDTTEEFSSLNSELQKQQYDYNNTKKNIMNKNLSDIKFLKIKRNDDDFYKNKIGSNTSKKIINKKNYNV